MPKLDAEKRARLPGSAFAYVDSRGRRRLPIHDASHVKNALARFNQVGFEDDAARERARTRLLHAAKKYGIVPVGFITGQLESERRNATAGRLVIELGRHGAPGELEQRLRSVLRDPTLAVLHWSEASGAYLDRAGRPTPLPADDGQRGVTFLERQGRPMTALIHDKAVLDDPGLAETVLAAVRFVVEKELLHGQIQATATDAAALPTGFVTLLMTDIESSTGLLRRLGDRYGDVLNDVRSILRNAVLRAGGREIDARADELFAVFERPRAAIEAAVAMQRALAAHAWPADADVRVRAGIHSGRPTLTDVGYIGLAVHATARVCSAAHGGQVVVSGDARAAVGNAAPAGLRFRTLGRHRLAGLPEPVALFQVQAKGLRASFPPPRISRSATPRGEVARTHARPHPTGRPSSDSRRRPVAGSRTRVTARSGAAPRAASGSRRRRSAEGS
jgi:class 3 adenylate cyclase